MTKTREERIKHLQEATTLVATSLKENSRLIVPLVKGFVVGVVNMELDRKVGRMNVLAAEILIDIYAQFPGLREEIEGFVNDYKKSQVDTETGREQEPPL